MDAATGTEVSLSYAADKRKWFFARRQAVAAVSIQAAPAAPANADGTPAATTATADGTPAATTATAEAPSAATVGETKVTNQGFAAAETLAYCISPVMRPELLLSNTQWYDASGRALDQKDREGRTTQILVR